MLRFPRRFRTERARRRHRRVVLTDASVISVGLLMVLAGLIAALQSPVLRIHALSIEGARIGDEALIRDAAEDTLSTRRGLIFPGDSAVFLSAAVIEAAVTEALPRLSEAAVERRGIRGIAIAVAERDPIALWCGDVVPELAYLVEGDFREQCYFVDDGGIIYERAPSVTGPSYPRFWGAIDRGNPLGAQFVPGEEFAALVGFMRDLAKEGVVPLGLLVIDEHELELYDETGMRILMLRGGDYPALADTLGTIQESGVLDGRDASVEYLDLRFGDRAYFKSLSDRPAQAPHEEPQPQEVVEESDTPSIEPAMSEE